MIDVHDLSYEAAGHLLLDGVSTIAEDGAVLGIIGPNGAGKSTLLRLLYRAIEQSTGTVVVDGHDLRMCRRREIAQRMAVVPQRGEAQVPLTVRESVALGRLSRRGLRHFGDAADARVVREAIARVGLADKAERLLPELSGGEVQRVLIARAIAQQATHVLLDEPTNHLDIRHQFEVMDLVRGLGATCVIVLHDLNLAARYCDRLLLLHEGRIRAQGSPAEVLQPGLLSEVYQVRAQALRVGGRLHLLFENPADPAAAAPGPEHS